MSEMKTLKFPGDTEPREIVDAKAREDIGGKQDKSTLEADVAAKGFTKNTGTYIKPAGGIPKSDLAAAVQTSLGKADTALQEHQSLAAYRKAAAQDAIDAQKQSIITDLETIRSGAAKGATAVQPESGKGLFSGSYNDLTDKPTIPDISGKQDKLIAGEGITIASDGKTISSSGKVSSVNGKTGAVTLNAEDIIYAKESQKLDVTIASLKAADAQMASDISELQTADASLDSRITAIETGDTPVTLYIYWESVVGGGLVSLTKNGTAMSVTDFISKMQSGAKIIIGENNDSDSESSGFSNYRYKITDSTTASLAFDVANSFNGSNRTVIISGSSSTNGLMTGYQNIDHDDLSDYSPLPEGSTPASKAWVENYINEKAAALQTKSITDTGSYFTTDTVEGALQEIGAHLNADTPYIYKTRISESLAAGAIYFVTEEKVSLIQAALLDNRPVIICADSTADNKRVYYVISRCNAIPTESSVANISLYFASLEGSYEATITIENNSGSLQFTRSI